MLRAARSSRSITAFTLMEALVVTAVISVLVSTLLPAMGMAREVGRRVSCASNLGQVVRAGHAYAADHNGDWCLASTPTMDANNSYWTPYPERYVHYGRLFKSYLNGDGRVLYCPSATLFSAADPDYGVAWMGVSGQQAAGPYLQRGVPEGAPRSTNDTGRPALITDFNSDRAVPFNHGQWINTVYLDGAVTSGQTPAGWYVTSANGHGGDSFPGAGDGAWSQLDRHELE